MIFDLTRCVNYISANTTKKISVAFGNWIKGDNITRRQWIALYFIYYKKELTQRDLSIFMEINDSSTMRLIDRIEREGWVERVRSTADRRKIMLDLTDEGIKLINKVLHFGEEFNAVLIKGISQEKLDIFQEVQYKMYENIMNDKRSK